MKKITAAVFILAAFGLFLTSCTPAPSKSACPVTTPPDSLFVPPAGHPYPNTEGYFLFGSNELWTELPLDGSWRGLPYHDPDLPEHSGGYLQKLVWWRQGYDYTKEEKPDLQVSGVNLDDPSLTFTAPAATNGYHPDYGSFMLVGVDIPAAGCWEIGAVYQDRASLSYVVWIEP